MRYGAVRYEAISYQLSAFRKNQGKLATLTLYDLFEDRMKQ